MKTSHYVLGVISIVIIAVVSAYFLYAESSETELSSNALEIASIASKTCGGKEKIKRVHSKGFECK